MSIEDAASFSLRSSLRLTELQSLGGAGTGLRRDVPDQGHTEPGSGRVGGPSRYPAEKMDPHFVLFVIHIRPQFAARAAITPINGPVPETCLGPDGGG